MQRTISAIIIDPATRTVRQEQLTSDLNGELYHALKRAVFGDNETGHGYIEHISLGADHGIYIDEEGVLKPWDEQHFFRLGENLTIAGRAVLVKDTPDGDSADCELSIDYVTAPITWMEAKDVRVPAPFMETFNPKTGQVERELLAGVEFWTYDNQPS